MVLKERHVHHETGVVNLQFTDGQGKSENRRYASVKAEKDNPDVYEKLVGSDWVKVHEGA